MTCSRRSSQGSVFTETFKQLKELAAEFLQLSLADILKRLAGIHCVAIFDPDPVTRIVLASVMAGSSVVMFGSETTGAVIF